VLEKRRGKPLFILRFTESAVDRLG
jgi:hypothetical protein